MKRCPRCNTPLPLEARFCWNCGAEQPMSTHGAGAVLVRIDLYGNLEAQLNEGFFLALRDRVEREHEAGLFASFSERLYTSGFRDAVSRRIAQLAELLGEMRDSGEANPAEVNGLMDDLFEDMLDLFMVRYAQDLCEISYPEAILKYQYADLNNLSLTQMILDYLQPETEAEEYYTDFLRMPVEKLRQVSKSFLFPAKDEKILLITDQSILGSGKDGYAFTDRALYWKAPLQKPQYVAFTQLRDYRKVESWITINEHYFHASASLNQKMLRLLSRLQRLFS